MDSNSNPEPRGFSEHTRKSSGENAHQQGWGLNEEERKQAAGDKTAHVGGTDYDYGARDFGDSPADTSAARTPANDPGSQTNPKTGTQGRKTGT